MPPKYLAGIQELEAAQQGASRLVQAEVQAPKRIIEEVSEDEYRRIMQTRRDEDFVVGSRTFGYEESGKEIWEGAEAAREHNRAAAERQAAKAQPQGSKRADAPGAGTAAAAASSAPLHQSFQAGAHAGSSASMAAARGDSIRHKELDDLMNQMLGSIPDSSSSEAAKGEKRKAEGVAAAGGASKRATVEEPLCSKDVEMTSCSAPPAPLQAGAGVGAKVKAEPVEGAANPVVVHSAGQAAAAVPVKSEVVKQEPADGAAVPAVVVPPEAQEAAQMRAWLSGGTCEGVMAAPEPAPISSSPGSAGSKLQLEQDGGLWFFFIDAFEDDRASPPRLYLFGKARTGGGKGYSSCCLVVEKVERCVHLLLNVDDPDDEAQVQEAARNAEQEFAAICHQRCPGVKRLRAKLKQRNYAFEKALKYGNGELPFLKVVLDAAGQLPPANLAGEHFSHLFGATTSQLERFLTQKRIMGPSWLRLQPGSWREDPARLSHCALELRITPASVATPKTDEDRRNLTAQGMPTSSPPLRMLTINMQTVQRSPQQPHEPVAICCTMHPRLNPDAPENDRDLRDGMEQWCAIRRLDSRPLPRDAETVLRRNGVKDFNSEASMLTGLLAKIHEFDPDVIAGHNAYGFDLDVIATRLHQLKVQGWQKFGRLRRPKDRVPHLEHNRGAGYWVGSSLAAGRLVCDLMLQAKDLLPKLGAHDLVTLAHEHLGAKDLRVVEPEELPKYWDKAEALNELAELTFFNALSVARLTHSLQILPLTKQLTNLAGNGWNASLQNKRAERNEMLLCHEFHKRKFILPDREPRKRRGAQPAVSAFDDPDGAGEEGGDAGRPKRGKAAYSGGLVLEPKAGLYDEYVMMLDFNSLYPSIIQEHNICFTTVERPNEQQVAQCGSEADLLAQTHQPDGMLDEGVLPQVLRRLVETRRSVKGAIKYEKDARRKKLLDIRQLALKLTANSMYGCLGFQNSRFYAKPLAAMITARGRDALQTAISVVTQELALEVVYGDTDSVFVNTKTQDYRLALQAAQQIKTSVNKKYKRLEIEIDAVFGRLLLLKKKKYAAIKISEAGEFEMELKGLDIVRRDWCPYAKQVGHAILKHILESSSKEEAVHWVHSYLQERREELDARKVETNRFVITKGLTKDPKDYPDAKNQPHVQVALRLINRGKSVRPGQEVGYVVCEPSEGTEGKVSLADKARAPHELMMDPTLRVDVEWYKKQQVHPLVSRLLAPVEGTDAARLAECLGLDGARFAQAAAAHEAVEAGDDSTYARMAGNDVNALFDRKVRWKEYASRLSGVECTKCKETTPWKELLQPESSQANGINSMFCCSKCPEQIKPKRAQNLLTMQLRRLLKEHCEGWVQPEGEECIEKTRRLSCGQNMVGAGLVLRELEFMEHLCEAESFYDGQDPRGCREAAVNMRRTVKWLLETNGFNWVDCKQIFTGIFGDR